MKGSMKKNKSMTEDGVERSVRGKANIAAGRVKDAVGGLTGNSKMQMKGKLQTAKGRMQDATGKVERELDKDMDEEVGSDSDY
jgi:uncharacterized protein YjbJ (UPF0337 family)